MQENGCRVIVLGAFNADHARQCVCPASHAFRVSPVTPVLMVLLTPRPRPFLPGNELRLTGKHETCDMNTFRSGVADRGASIRIPLPVQRQGYGYLEDRRPAANVDPYTVARLLIKTILT